MGFTEVFRVDLPIFTTQLDGSSQQKSNAHNQHLMLKVFDECGETIATPTSVFKSRNDLKQTMVNAIEERLN